MCLIVRKYAIDSKRDIKEQLFDGVEILFDLSNFRRPVEVGEEVFVRLGSCRRIVLGDNWKKYSKNSQI